MEANGNMDILRWPHIRLTEEEARSIIQTWDKTLNSEDTFQNMYQISDGWVAGLVLMAAAKRNQKIKSTFIGKSSFDEIIAYFGQEIFNHLDAKTRDFFLRTAFLPKMTADMAEQLTGEPLAHDILQTMNKRNYFITRHGNVESVYEYHPLYRDFLLSRAEKLLTPGQMRDIQLQSANLLEKNGQIEAAVFLLRELQDWNALTKLLLSTAPDMLKQGRHHVLRERLESLPVDILDANPWLLYFKGMSILPFDPSAAQKVCEQAFEKFQKKKDIIGAMMAAAGVIQSLCLGYDDFTPLDHWYVILNQLASKVGSFPSEEIEALVVTSLIMASTFRELFFSETDKLAKRMQNITETSGTIDMKVQALHYFLWRRLSYNGPHEALPLLNELKRLSIMHEERPLISIIAQSAAVQYYLHDGLHDELLHEAQKGLAISQKTGIHYLDMWFNLHVVASFVGRMDYKGAVQWLNKIMQAVEGWPKWPKAFYHSLLMQMALFRREYASALREGEQALDFFKQIGSPFSVAFNEILMAQLLRIMGRREESFEYLKKARLYAEQKQNNALMIVVLMCEAQFALQDGDNPRGLSLLKQSISLAREGGFVYLCDEPNITLRICEKALEEGIEVEYVQHIIRRRNFVPEQPPVHLENWPWAVKIYTMGRFVILINDSPLSQQRKMQQTPLRLLKALISSGGKEISQEWLADTLWPDAEGDAAHHALETTLQRLRKLLGYPEAIRLTDGKLSFDDHYCWVDARAFERLLGEADSCKAHETLKKKGLIEKAINLYNGAFLTGEKEESWMIAFAERLKAKYFKSIWWLVAYLQEQGQWAQASVLCEKFLEVDECREEIYRNLMICHQKLERTSEALLVYQRCCKVLSSVLGIGPSPAMQAIYKAILSEKSQNPSHKH
jgi:LuxR family maltose regulon positive regulatory protein